MSHLPNPLDDVSRGILESQATSKAGIRNILAGMFELLDRPQSVYLIVGFGVLLRGAALATVMSQPLRNEAPGYERMALQFLHGERFAPYWPPGVPYYLSAFHRLFGESLLVARASIIPVYAVFSFLLYFLAAKLSSRRMANFLVLAFVFYPPYIRFSFNPSTEFPAATCLLGLVFLGILVVRNPSWAVSAGLGCAIGALILIRPSSMLFAAAVPLYVFLKTRKAWISVIPLGVAALLISAWLWKAQALSGRLVPINNANWENFYLGNNPQTPLYKTWPEGQAESGFPKETLEQVRYVRSLPPADQSRVYRKTAFEHILARPDLFLLRTLNRARAYFGFPIHHAEPLEKYLPTGAPRRLVGMAISIMDAAFYWPIMALAILFVFSPADPRARPDCLIPILGAVLVYALPYWISFSQPRFNFPVVPLFGVLAAGFVESLLQKGDEHPLAQVYSVVRQNRGALAALALFFYIQIEWLLFA